MRTCKFKKIPFFIAKNFLLCFATNGRFFYSYQTAILCHVTLQDVKSMLCIAYCNQTDFCFFQVLEHFEHTLQNLIDCFLDQVYPMRYNKMWCLKIQWTYDYWTILPDWTDYQTINVTEGSDFVEDYLSNIKLLQSIPSGLVKEDKGWILDI